MNPLEKEFVPYSEALELKQLDFDEDCFRYYNDDFKLSTLGLFYTYDNPSDFVCLAPTYSQCFRWFREKYKLHIEIRSYTARFFTIVIQECKDIVKYIEYGGINLKFNTYEEAELTCLRKLIEIVKNK